MNINNLIEKIEVALVEADRLTSKSNFYTNDSEPIRSTKYVLNLLRKELSQDNKNINNRVLRAMHDLGMSSYKDFENTPLESALNNVISLLYNELPEYKKVQPLRADFGKGDPI